jgi:DNA-binding CsgD family transcriptional regulator/tetratricopeptide (TPR) repeat protein
VLYGRDSERARIGELLDAARTSRSGALILRGDPGIGKSALLEDARDRAIDMHVLSARGVESESELPFAGLHQLLRPALDLLDTLPVPQAAALRSALGLEVGPGHERFLIFAGCLSLLAELAERRPVLCLVDDAHWLDAASADALRFVAHRLDAEGIVMLFGVREGDVRTFEAPDVPTLMLDGLDEDAAATLLQRRSGVEPAPSVRATLVERTKGNALALLEVPTALTAGQLAGDEPLPEALPMTTQVETVFLARVRRLSPAAQQLLLVAAADDSEHAAVVSRAAESLGVGPDALEAAEQAGLIAIHGTRLEFRHPLVRSAVYDAATSLDRRAVHAAIAAALGPDDADRRAWHLSASVLEPDEDVVLALEAAAERAQERAGFAAAAKALERAAELSADSPARGRRLVAAARAASFGGADAHAVALAERALPLVDEPVSRAEIARVRAVWQRSRGRPGDGIPMLLEAAHDVAHADPGKALELLFSAFSAGSDSATERALHEAAATADTVTPAPDDEEALFLSSLVRGLGAMVAGDPARGSALIGEGLLSSATQKRARNALWASACALWLGDDMRVATLADRAAELARSQGALGTLGEALSLRAAACTYMQRYDEAVVAAEEAIRYARELGSSNLVLFPLAVIAHVAAVRGEDAKAVGHAEEILRVATPHGLGLRVANAMRVLALLDLGRGRWVAALERYQALADRSSGFRDAFSILSTTPDLVEAAVRAGRREVAERAFPAYEAWANAGAPRVRSRAASCRALLADGDVATEHFEEALRLRGAARPFDSARIHLLYGEHLRRERRRTDARIQLRAALDAFEAFRAEPWAERARTELRATGETARKRDPSTVSQLTPQELQVARLVSDGLSNKEVAAQLFLSPRTIDSHLRNVFAKLGVTSRVQLARMSLGGDGQIPEPTEVVAPA